MRCATLGYDAQRLQRKYRIRHYESLRPRTTVFTQFEEKMMIEKENSTENLGATLGSPIELQATVTVKERHEEQPGCPNGFYVWLGSSLLTAVLFDNRYEDGRQWVVRDAGTPPSSLLRVATKQEALQAICDRYGLECPPGGPFDVGQEDE